MRQAMNNLTAIHTQAHIARTSNRERGFTFIEIMIAVVIVGILTALALPSYGNYVRDARRSDGHLALLQAAQAMERCKSTSWSYASCTIETTSPEDYYTLAQVAADASATTYTITATATGAQASDSACSPMSINHLGVKTPLPPSNCWKN